MIDKKLAHIRALEEERQQVGLELIASENYVSKDVMQAYANVFTNKYSEGVPGARYYGGQEVVDQLEFLTQHRALRLFNLLSIEAVNDGAGSANNIGNYVFHGHIAQPSGVYLVDALHSSRTKHPEDDTLIKNDLTTSQWAVNVQPLSGSPANLAVYMGVLKPGDTVLAMDLSAGGHLTHGHTLNGSAIYYNFVSYGVRQDTFEIDYEGVRSKALECKPAMILAGFSAYTKTIDWGRFAAIADEVSNVHGYRPLLMADIAHIAGLIAGGVLSTPFPYFDIVTTTTHKTLRGPRGALIYTRRYDNNLKETGLEKKVNRGVFPGLQGGPHEHVIFAKAVAFYEALQPAFHDYAQRVIENAQVLAEAFVEGGWHVVSGGTENHIVLLDVTKHTVRSFSGDQGEGSLGKIVTEETGLTGKQAEYLLEEIGISTNKNMIPFDNRSPMNPSGLRLGTPALTTRGMGPHEVREIVAIICDALTQERTKEMVQSLTNRVTTLCKKFPLQ